MDLNLYHELKGHWLCLFYFLATCAARLSCRPLLSFRVRVKLSYSWCLWSYRIYRHRQ